MGSGEFSNGFRERLERNLDSLQSTLQQTNERNRPQPIQPQPSVSNHMEIGAVAGGAIGAAIGGPPGAILGGLVGGLFGSIF